jgi:hypothetical protein
MTEPDPIRWRNPPEFVGPLASWAALTDVVYTEVGLARNCTHMRVMLRTPDGAVELFRTRVAVVTHVQATPEAIAYTQCAGNPEDWFEGMYNAAVKHMAIKALEKPL